MSKSSNHILVPTKNKSAEDLSIDDLRYLGKDNFLMWCLASGVKVDHNPIDFDKHRYLIPIYMDNSEHIVWQKAAQLGASIWAILRILWWLENHQGRKAGFYFPTKDGVDNLSKDRLSPLIESAPSIKAIADQHDKLGLRKIGQSSFYLYHLGGVASKDSVPLDYLAFDEVRLCDPKDIDQTLHRISHSPYKVRVFASTAGIPNSDINARYTRGNQLTWMSACGCSDGCDLPSQFPDCVITDDPRRPKEVYLRCTDCGWEIKDPQNGRYVALNPGADFNSYRVSQLVSKFRTPKEIWEEYVHTTNKQEFYNAALGLPFIDAANQGVSATQLSKCVNPELRWMKDEPKRSRTSTAMGVDQGGMYNMVVIADINPDGTKKRVRHVEIIEQNNPEYFRNGESTSPFARLHELMDEFNVDLCVVDLLPNYNEALKFAQSFPKRVFLASFQKEGKDVVQWMDRAKTKESIKKSGPLLNFKYQAKLGRFPFLSFALGEWADGNVEIPPLHSLKQMCYSEDTNRLLPESPAERLFLHLPKFIKRWHETDPETKTGRWEWITSGPDHLGFAWAYCNVALERLRRKPKYAFL